MATLRTSNLHDNKYEFSVQTWTNKQGICYAIFNDADGKQIKRTFGGYAPNQHHLADSFVAQLTMLTGASAWIHDVQWDRTHRNASGNCNSNLTPLEVRELTSR